MLAIRTAVVSFLFAAALHSQQPPSGCLSYEPAMEHVTGKLTIKTFPGPPNYESVQKGDREESSLLIELHHPVCVAEDKNDPDLNPSQGGVTAIQLVLEPEAYKTYKPMVGREVVATGTLFGAHTGHHHTPVLLTVKTIESAHH